MKTRFENRAEAGKLLAESLRHYAGDPSVLVLGLARGGVPVAYEVAKRLRAPLDVFVVRKLGTPGNEELAMGAVASGGVRVLNREVVDGLGIPMEIVDTVTEQELRELERRETVYRSQSVPPDYEGKTVLLIDDGVATGATLRSAIRAIRMQHPARLVVAVPTAAGSTAAVLQEEVDEWIALMTPEPFYAVGAWYADFGQTQDAEVCELLRNASEWSPEAGSEPRAQHAGRCREPFSE
jgi:putative phosphoribosyl transferase